MKNRTTFPALLLLPALVLLTSCATPKEPPPVPFLGTRWQVVLDIPEAGEAPMVRFGDGRMEGFGGCNRIAARYVEDVVGASAIAIGRIQSGKRACAPGPQAAEDQILEVLQSVSSYTITGNLMTMSGSGGTLRFRALGVPAKKP